MVAILIFLIFIVYASIKQSKNTLVYILFFVCVCGEIVYFNALIENDLLIFLIRIMVCFVPSSILIWRCIRHD